MRNVTGHFSGIFLEKNAGPSVPRVVFSPRKDPNRGVGRRVVAGVPMRRCPGRWCRATSSRVLRTLRGERRKAPAPALRPALAWKGEGRQVFPWLPSRSMVSI
nr:MAG TPA: hypothetical protein [Caudoviricetes sp.]